MKVLVTEYNQDRHELVCEVVATGATIRVDPFVCCEIPHDDANALVGKRFSLTGCWKTSAGVYLMTEGGFTRNCMGS